MLQLQPFPKLPHPNIQIHAHVKCIQQQLTIKYQITGGLSDIILPAFQGLAEGDDLWQSTCLECFLLLDDAQSYIELNFSPQGLWHIYYFSKYRVAAKQTNQVLIQSIDVQNTQSSYVLTASVKLENITLKDMGLTAVIETNAQQLSYWALRHGAEQPDFHLADSFILPVKS